MNTFVGRNARCLLAATVLSLVTSLAYAGDMLVLPPAPAALRSGQLDFFKLTPDSEKNNKISLFYATQRLATDKKAHYSKKYDDTLRVGVASLLIGPENLDWDLLHSESTSAERTQEFDITLSNVDQLGELKPDDSVSELSPGMKAYVDQINTAIANNSIKNITIIVHGAFNSFYYAAAEAAQYQFYTGKQVAVIAYSWPAVPNMLRYKANVKHAEDAEAGLVRLIKILGKHSIAERIHILGYSVGGRLTGGAIAKLVDEYEGQDLAQVHTDLRLGHLYLTSSDEPIDEFRKYASRFAQLFDLITVTVAYDDPILGRAQLTGGGKRLGRPVKKTDKHAPTAEQMQDVLTAIEKNQLHVLNLEIEEIPGYAFSHGAWYLNPWVSSDVLVSMNLNLHPSERGLSIVEKEGARFWYFPPEYIDSLEQALLKYKQAKEKATTAADPQGPTDTP